MSAGFYGVVSQPLTADYLAKQLTMFEAKVPKQKQVQPFKFPTNCPPNIPCPSLFPGEVIRLQQHRVVCTEVFEEPAVGALYITNFRIIFYGNLISDPESLDALQGVRTSATLKKDSTLAQDIVGSFSKGAKFKFSRSKNEPNFVSHVVSQDSEASTEKLTLPRAQRIKSGLRKLGSLRRSPNRITKPSGSSSPRPYISAPMPLIDTDNLDHKLQYPQGFVVVEDDSEEGTKQVKSYVLGYHPDEVSCEDSVSVSSQSEFSMTGTDERSTASPLGDGTTTTSSSDPIDIVNGRVCISGEESDPSLVPDSGLLWDSSIDGTLCADDSCHTLDSGVNLLESISEDHHPMIPNGKGSSGIQALNGEKPSSSNNEKKRIKSKLSNDSVDFERVPSDLKPKLEVKSCQNMWKDSIVKPESDSDTDSERSTPRVARKTGVTFEIGSIDTKLSELSLQQGPPVVHLSQTIKETSDEQSGVDSTPVHTTETQVSPSQSSEQEHLQPKFCTEPKHSLQTTVSNEPQYANLFMSSHRQQGGSVVVAPSTTERPRSKSSSPRVPKKPKPLPRTWMLGSHKEEQPSKENLFISSLPADFRPVRPLRPAKTHTPPSTGTESHLKSDSPKELEPKQQQEQQKQQEQQQQLQQQQEEEEEKQPCTKLLSDTEPKQKKKDEKRAECDEPMPIPPPRRKRTTKRGRTVHSTGSESSSTDPALTSPEEPLSPATVTPTHSSTLTSETGQNGHIGNDATPSFSTVADTTTTNNRLRVPPGRRAQPQSTTTELCRSLSDDDVFTSLKEEALKSQPIDRSTVRRRSLPHIDEDNGSEITLKGSVRTSHTSMAVMSSGSGVPYQRPYSVIVSPFDTTQEFNFPDDKQVSLTVPRNQNGVMVWYSPRVSQKAQKSPMPESTRYTLSVSFPLNSIHSVRKLQSVNLKEQGIKLPEGILVLCRNFHSMKLYIHPHNTYDADGLKQLMEKQFICRKPIHLLFAFEYRSAIRHPNPTFLHNRSLPNHFNITGEIKRLGLLHSNLWSIRSVLLDHPEICSSYPPHVIVPICTPDMDLIRAASLYNENRFPTLTWVDRDTGAALLRAASTKDERHGSANLLMDEALLGAISGSNSSARGKCKLYIFTEKSESRSGTGFNDPIRTEQVRTYFYHNCKFVYSVDPPTFKSTRHSFNRLQALLENSLPDDQFLIALDTTHWLPRISELLTTATAVCRALFEKAANVLVCYEAGWDRTTQVVSLAQLLLDPYYRTMDGFQVLVQKEWVWFGHPFRARHSRHDKAKEDGPVFLQWIDCVWQIMHQCPSAFEFNEKFLMVIVEHSYSSLFGTFMTNSEHERKQTFSEQNYTHMSVSTHTVSFWTWVSMINSAGRMFYNKLYNTNTYSGVIHPRCAVPCLKLWMSHYCKYKPQENFNQPSNLHRHLEELVRTYKTLENTRNELEPTFSRTNTNHSHQIPPPLMPRDEIQRNAGAKIVNGNHLSTPTASRAKPIPPPKPPKQYFSGKVEDYLRKQGIDPAVCKHIELSGTTCQGSLCKLGAVRKNWLQRWFVLDFESENLAYFENQSAFQSKEAPKGVIHLCDVTRVHQSIKRKDHLLKNIFMIDTPNRTYLIQAPSIITMECWMACLTMPLNYS